MSPVQMAEKGRHDHQRDEHERGLDGKADQVIERILEVGPNPSRQYDAQRQENDKAENGGGDEQAHVVIPFPLPAPHLAARVEPHSSTPAPSAKVWAGPSALATLAGVFAATPLCDEAPLTARDIHARVATWSLDCTRRVLRDLVAAGIAEGQTVAPPNAGATPTRVYRRTAVKAVFEVRP